MTRIRWGLCCQFSQAPIKFHTTTVAYLTRLKARGQRPEQYLSAIILKNLSSLFSAIQFCAQNGIGNFRITSEFLPCYTHPICGYELEAMDDVNVIQDGFKLCKSLAKKHQIRLTLHPDQFVVLNSPKPDVVDSAIKELEYHAVLAELLGVDVINIHAGGMYGNKIQALERFASNFARLSKPLKKLLTVENDDRCFTPEDLLPLCHTLDIPLVYDVHHHRCLRDTMTIEQASTAAYKTWKREPLFHISSPRNGWDGKQPQHHHDYIDSADFPTCWLNFPKLTIEVEAKAKELAVLQLMHEIK